MQVKLIIMSILTHLNMEAEEQHRILIVFIVMLKFSDDGIEKFGIDSVRSGSLRNRLKSVCGFRRFLIKTDK